MVQRNISPGLLTFRQWVRTCMRAKNLKGSDAATIRAELADCSRRFRQAVEEIGGASEQELQQMAERAARDFLNNNRR